jgi:hypothetical protein
MDTDQLDKPGPSCLPCQQFDLFEATFAPLRTDNLKLGPLRMVGKRLVWKALWVIEDGEYAGQWAMAPPVDMPSEFREGVWAWAPACDLKDAVATDRRLDGGERADNAKLNPAYRP